MEKEGLYTNGSSRNRMEYVAWIVGFCVSDNEPSGSIKHGEFLDCVRMHSFLNKVSPA